MNPSPSFADLKARLDPLTPIFILIDPLLGEPLPIQEPLADCDDPSSLRDAEWQRPTTVIRLNKKVPLPLHQHPYFVEVNGIDDPLLEMTWELAQAEYLGAIAEGLDGDGGSAFRIGGWLQSSLSPAILATELAQIMRVNTETYTKATYLRLADRRVLSLLRHVIGDNRITAQFGRIQRWIYLDLLGQAAQLSSTSEDKAPLLLSHDEWALMEQGEKLHRTLAVWIGERAKIDSNTLQDRPLSQYFSDTFLAIAESSKAAQQWPQRFEHPTDQIIWAALMLLYPKPKNHQAINHLMQRSGTPEDPVDPVRYIQAELKLLLDSKKQFTHT